MAANKIGNFFQPKKDKSTKKRVKSGIPVKSEGSVPPTSILKMSTFIKNMNVVISTTNESFLIMFIE